MKQVALTLETKSVQALTTSGQRLFVWKAVATSDVSTAPLIWSVRTISPQMAVGYGPGLAAFTSTDDGVVEGRAISVGFQSPIAPGQRLVLAKNGGGGGNVLYGGSSTAVTIENATGVEYLCGLMQTEMHAGAPSPCCATKLFGQGIETIGSADRLLFGFSSAPRLAGDYVRSLQDADSAARRMGTTGEAAGGSRLLLVDLSGADLRSVSYDSDRGWSWGGGVWASQVPAGRPLAATLIEGGR
jgi:hypothetical protein